MSGKIHFKLTHAGVTRRFALSRDEEDLVAVLRARVLKITGACDLSLFWRDEDSNIVLETGEDLDAAVDYALTKNKLGCITLEIEEAKEGNKETKKFDETKVVTAAESAAAFNGFAFMCDGCDCYLAPSNGGRFKCNVCEDYDLCAACLAKDHHQSTHAFVRLLDGDTVLQVNKELMDANGGEIPLLAKDAPRCSPKFDVKNLKSNKEWKKGKKAVEKQKEFDAMVQEMLLKDWKLQAAEDNVVDFKKAADRTTSDAIKSTLTIDDILHKTRDAPTVPIEVRRQLMQQKVDKMQQLKARREHAKTAHKDMLLDLQRLHDSKEIVKKEELNFDYFQNDDRRGKQEDENLLKECTGDWTCGKCEVLTFQKADEKKAPKGEKLEYSRDDILNKCTGDWRCAKCKVINYKQREACFRCNAPKNQNKNGKQKDEKLEYSRDKMIEINFESDFPVDDLPLKIRATHPIPAVGLLIDYSERDPSVQLESHGQEILRKIEQKHAKQINEAKLADFAEKLSTKKPTASTTPFHDLEQQLEKLKLQRESALTSQPTSGNRSAKAQPRGLRAEAHERLQAAKERKYKEEREKKKIEKEKKTLDQAEARELQRLLGTARRVMGGEKKEEPQSKMDFFWIEEDPAYSDEDRERAVWRGEEVEEDQAHVWTEKDEERFRREMNRKEQKLRKLEREPVGHGLRGLRPMETSAWTRKDSNGRREGEYSNTQLPPSLEKDKTTFWKISVKKEEQGETNEDQKELAYKKASQIPAHMTIEAIQELFFLCDNNDDILYRINKNIDDVDRVSYSHEPIPPIFVGVSEAYNEELTGNIAVDLLKHLRSLREIVNYKSTPFADVMKSLENRIDNLKKALEFNGAAGEDFEHIAKMLQPVLLTHRYTTRGAARCNPPGPWHTEATGFMKADARRGNLAPPRVASADPQKEGLFAPFPQGCVRPPGANAAVEWPTDAKLTRKQRMVLDRLRSTGMFDDDRRMVETCRKAADFNEAFKMLMK